MFGRNDRADFQILESEYFNHREKWEAFARRKGGLEICDDETGQPIYVI